MKSSKVIVIVGPTGSGKTAVSVQIAKEIGGEIISADSRAIYKGMDLGTAKPSLEEREGVLHFGFDLVEPGERFTVADFKEYAEQKIYEIEQRGHIPIIVGGTGLYVDALVYDYKFRGRTGEKADEDASIEQKNCTDRTEMSSKFKIFGVKTEPEILRKRLEERANKLFV
ncbi:MAG: isopentenyl transferase family protein, partial [Candidatus Saccharibacteria bacterium]|nr:isopentenyl transferase family protein [Candidatus Saccharibacteria bacterium]